MDKSEQEERFFEWLRRHRSWSQATFGPNLEVSSTTEHIDKELAEVRDDPSGAEEWVDIITLAIDGLQRYTGLTDQQIMDAIEAKQSKNEKRVWPDWQTIDTSKAVEHDRSHD